MDADILAHLHAYARTGVDAIDSGLGRAPHAQAGREIAIDGACQGQSAIDELVAALEPDDPALKVGVETEAPRHCALIDPAFKEQCKGVAAAAIAADPLTPLGRDPHRQPA